MQTSPSEDHKMDESDIFHQTQNLKTDEQHLNMEFPFDLNNLFSMQYSFDTLKQAIEFLAKQQRSMRGDIAGLRTNQKEAAAAIERGEDVKVAEKAQPGTPPAMAAVAPQQIIQQINNVVAPAAPEVTRNMYDDLKELIKTNKESAQAQIDGVKTDLDGLKNESSSLKERMGDAETAIDFLKKLGAPSGGGGGAGLLDALNDMTEKLRQEFNDKLRESKEVLQGQMGTMDNDLLKRLQALEDHTKQIDDDQQAQIDDLKLIQNSQLSQIEQNQSDIKILKTNKCNQDDFDTEIFDIRDILSKLGTGQKVEVRAASPKEAKGPKITQEDIDRWNNAANKTKEFDKMFDKLSKDLELVVQLKSRVTTLESKQGDYATKEELLKVQIEQKNTKVVIDGVSKEQSWLKKELEKLAAQLAKFDSPTRQEFEMLKSRVDALENQFSNLKKQIDGILQKLKGLKASSGAGGADQDLVDKCIDEIKKLRSEFEAHRDKALKNLNDLNTEMPNKADKIDLINLENRLMDQMRDMISQLMNQMPNKDDIMKKFAQFAKKIKEIIEQLAKLTGQPNEDDAMFTKKPYGPTACASCEKGLINIQGMPVDYHVWKKLPFKEPGERIAKYGQGFSKILSNMKGRTSVDFGVDGDYPGASTSTADDGYRTHTAGFRQRQTHTSTTNANGGRFSQMDSRNQKHHATHHATGSVDDAMVNQESHGLDSNYSKSPAQPRFVQMINNRTIDAPGSTDTLPKVAGGHKRR